MSEEITLELALDTIDEAELGAIESSLAAVNARRWSDTRDIGTVITVASSAAGLVTALLDLKDRLARRQGGPPPQIVVRNADRSALVLVSASAEQLEALLADQVQA